MRRAVRGFTAAVVASVVMGVAIPTASAAAARVVVDVPAWVVVAATTRPAPPTLTVMRGRPPTRAVALGLRAREAAPRDALAKARGGLVRRAAQGAGRMVRVAMLALAGLGPVPPKPDVPTSARIEARAEDGDGRAQA